MERIDELEAILKIFDESDFDELILEFNGGRVEARRGGAPSAKVTTQSRPVPAAGSPEPEAPASNPAPAPAPAPVEGNDRPHADDWVAIRSEISGTFYDSPSPTEDPFVSVGSKVSASDTVGMVEVMKLFTSVTAGIAGTVVEVVAKNGSAVSAGDVLLYLQPNV